MDMIKYINRMCLLLCSLVALIFTSCSEKVTKIEENKSEEDFSLIGKQVTIEYPEMKAEIQYLSDSTLHWQTTNQQNVVEKGIEKKSFQQVTGDLFFINWIEKDGITVSQVLDATKKEVYVYMSFSDKESNRGQRSATFMKGKVTFNN